MKKEKSKEGEPVVVFGGGTKFNGLLRFKETLCIRGRFKGTIEAAGDLIVDKDAVVEADHISVSSLIVSGTVTGAVHAVDKVDMLSGAKVRGDLIAARLRIADGVLFEGQCNMTGNGQEVDIFSRSAEELKAELQVSHG
ncbi:MAG: polymer-forming cytoskeletal protein [Treponema sp.]|jgi:cytoskeletal protein CcmA (bactofilin family)|nr:polymer-forming cytoskeletal protein [Treponema sp.]